VRRLYVRLLLADWHLSLIFLTRFLFFSRAARFGRPAEQGRCVVLFWTGCDPDISPTRQGTLVEQIRLRRRLLHPGWKLLSSHHHISKFLSARMATLPSLHGAFLATRCVTFFFSACTFSFCFYAAVLGWEFWVTINKNEIPGMIRNDGTDRQGSIRAGVTPFIH
jgi:hypothetical protein